MSTILLILVLLVGALALFAAEICTPTFGLLAVTGVGCLVGAVYLCFNISPVLGVVAIVALVFLVPAYLWAMIKYLPRTPLGRVLQLGARSRDPGEGTPEAAELEALLGKTAVAETTLRPSGAIRVGERRVIATAEMGFIKEGATVKVIKTVGVNVVVREVREE
jgi:membrane-bound serine protease (ClpP class)